MTSQTLHISGPLKSHGAIGLSKKCSQRLPNVAFPKGSILTLSDHTKFALLKPSRGYIQEVRVS